MPIKEKVILAWSGGKDSALTLCKLQRAYRTEVIHLLTNIDAESGRALAHHIPLALLQAQAESVGLPLSVVDLPPNPPNDVYEERIEEALAALRGPKIDQVAFGDIYLEDVRDYREAHLARIGMKGVYPLWGRESPGLAQEMLDLGVRAIVCCVDTTLLDASFVGRTYDADFLKDLPRYVDPCGENGEFHTFVYDGPEFQRPVSFDVGLTMRVGPRHVCLDLQPT